MTMIYDLQEGARHIRSYKHNQSRAMSQLLLPELKKPRSKINELTLKQIEKCKLTENKNRERRDKMKMDQLEK